MERHDAGQDPIIAPQAVLTGILAVRQSGLTNMLDRPRVAEIAKALGYDEASEWINAHRSEYVQGIFRGFKPVTIDWDKVQVSDFEDCRCGCGGRRLCGESDEA